MDEVYKMRWDQLENILARAMQPMKNRLLLLIGRAIIKAVNDGKPIQEVQISALAGESLDRIQRMQEFGFTSNPPAGTDAIMVSLGGNRENSVIIATDNRQLRIKNLASGETAVYTDDGTFIHLKKAGNIRVKAATKVLVETALAEFTGNVKILGNLEVVGTSLLTGIVTTMNNILVGINAIVTGIVQAAGFTGPSGGPLSTTVDITTSGNVSGGGTDLATVKSTFNAHTHPETGTTTGATSTPL